ncbi:MAG: hypothetical protein K940chlam3_00808 [Chlamydiae bacterium]|nr:hypothetical protein [Chlamydiota bacterium]
MKNFLIYFTPLLFIFAWWICAFTEYSDTASRQVLPVTQKAPFHSEVTPIDRDKLFRALNGDFDLMTRLIVEWDLEAQILEEKGYPGIRRLEREKILALLRDDSRNEKGTSESFFPQTYLSAGILLALIDETKITSLPRGIRNQNHIYASQKLQNITYNADPRSLETIGNGDHTLAFISPYSQPCTIQVMEQRGIPMVDLGSVTTEADLKQAIVTVGQNVHTESKAFILSSFIDATLFALDNHLATRKNRDSEILYVNHHTTFSAPNQKTLTGNFLKRLKINETLFEKQNDDWGIPLEIEDIVALDPDCIIFSGDSNSLQPLNSLSELQAAKNGQVYFVDQATQETQSQHCLLGYYDLYDILMRLP